MPYIHDDSIEELFINRITECPICHKVIDPRIANYFEMEDLYDDYDIQNQFLYLVTCYCKHCKNYFHAQFIENGNSINLTNIYPQHPEIEKISDKVVSLSPNFYKCYVQSKEAEACNLNLIAGIGYRKALEFLIKDYCISMNPNDEELICSLPLKKVIDRYIEQHKIKALAIAAAWLGNDEAHYVRKHIEYDINDLKAFIKAMLMYIESEFAFAEASNLISKPK